MLIVVVIFNENYCFVDLKYIMFIICEIDDNYVVSNINF